MPILIGFYQAIIRTEGIATGGEFLWFDLGAPDPLYLLPLIAGLIHFLQEIIRMSGHPNANPQMQMLLFIISVMIEIFASNLPAALALYWVVGNIFMIIQTYFIKGPNEAKVQAKDGGAGGAKK